jgi:copper chaperone NosL
MRKESRWMLVMAAALLVPVYALPLWSIRIVAPQYREGLGMFIGLRDIWGHAEHDIQNINILNHYIGMKPIDPAVVDILTIMPWVVGFLMIAALVVALIGKQWLVGAWLGAFTVLGTAGLLEFHSWNYDYGHNLDPMAPIKIPGMTYQPPVFGTKQLLNMSTSSYPSWGTLFVALAFLCGVLALVNELRGGAVRRSVAAAGARLGTGLRTAAGAAMVAAVALLTACGGAEPRELQAAAVTEFAPTTSECAYCEGTIAESRFGAQLTLEDGTVHHFLGIECMVGFLLEGRVAPDSVRAMQVVDFNHGERLLDASDAHFIRMAFERSPGGLDLVAVGTEKVAGTLHYFLGGERMTWDEVLEYVRASWNL